MGELIDWQFFWSRNWYKISCTKWETYSDYGTLYERFIFIGPLQMRFWKYGD